MGNYPHPLIAKEGWLYLSLSIAVSLLASFLIGWWSIPFWLITIFIAQFFRDPTRRVPENPNAVLSPADGKVIVMERAYDPYLKRDALKISVFMNVFNVHSNRSPLDAAVQEVWYHAGKFFNAALAKTSLENERNALWLRTKDGVDITCVQIAGLIARRILCYAKPGDTLSRGQRYGFIRFGSRVDVYLPVTAQPKVSFGEKVYATETILAELASD